MSKIKKIISINATTFLAILKLLFLATVQAHARCWLPPTPERLKNSTAVFSGQVLDIKSGEQVEEVRFKLIKSWKEVTKTEVIILNTRHHEAAHYQIGKTYLVFAYGDRENLRTGICTGTVEVQYAQNTIRELDRLIKHRQRK
jgi:hypothetical protein